MEIKQVWLWCGAGYQLTEIDIDEPTSDGQYAVEQAVVKALEGDAGSILFKSIEYMSEDEVAECEQYGDSWLYLDLTEYGHGCGYLLIENMSFKVEQTRH